MENPSEKELEQVIQALKDEDYGVRRRATYLLTKRPNPRAVSSLVERFRDTDEGVRQGAIRALIAIGNATVPLVIEALNDESKQVRIAAIETLWKIKDNRAIEPLIKLLLNHDEDPGYIRSKVAQALGDMGDARAIPALVQAFEVDQPSNLRIAALYALRELDFNTFFPLYLKALKDQDEKVLITALWISSRANNLP